MTETHDHNVPKTPLPKLSAPAQRALAGAGITSLEDLTYFSERTIRNLHGVGPNTIKPLLDALNSNNLSFKEG